MGLFIRRVAFLWGVFDLFSSTLFWFSSGILSFRSAALYLLTRLPFSAVLELGHFAHRAGDRLVCCHFRRQWFSFLGTRLRLTGFSPLLWIPNAAVLIVVGGLLLDKACILLGLVLHYQCDSSCRDCSQRQHISTQAHLHELALFLAPVSRVFASLLYLYFIALVVPRSPWFRT